jgi:phosphotransferase system HPr (HPr) family protein
MSGGPLHSKPLREAAGPVGSALFSAGPPGVQQGPDAMNGETLQRKVMITNPHGFHMRPASAFAQLAGRYQSTVKVYKDGQSINGKSPLELMFLAAEQGTELLLEVSGPDAHDAIAALAALLGAPSMDEQPQPPLPPKG